LDQYGGKKQAVMISLAHNKVIKALENDAFYSSILSIVVAGEKENVVLKDLQRHPSKAKILHLDLLRVSAKEAITMNTPLHFINEDNAPGVKEGGIVTHEMTDIEIKCLPKDLPEYLEVDLSQLGLDQVLHISDIQLPEGVELTTEITEAHDLPIASIRVPREIVEEEVVAEKTEGEGETEASGKGEGKDEDAPKTDKNTE